MPLYSSIFIMTYLTYILYASLSSRGFFFYRLHGLYFLLTLKLTFSASGYHRKSRLAHTLKWMLLTYPCKILRDSLFSIRCWENLLRFFLKLFHIFHRHSCTPLKTLEDPVKHLKTPSHILKWLLMHWASLHVWTHGIFCLLDFVSVKVGHQPRCSAHTVLPLHKKASINSKTK